MPNAKKEVKKNTSKNSVAKKNNASRSSNTINHTTKKPINKTIEKVETKSIEANKDNIAVKETNCKCNLMENTPFVIACCVIILLLAALIFTICIKRVPKTKDGNDILATMKGKTITADDLYLKLKEDGGYDSLMSLIDTYIADKEVNPTDEDKKYVDELVKSYEEYAKSYNVSFKEFMSNYVGLPNITTPDEFHDFVLADYKKTLAVIKYVGDEASEKDLKEYYENNYSDTITARHILIQVDGEDEEADKKAYDRAVKLIEELNKTDKKKLESKFEDLAKNNSDDTVTYSNGGLVENFTKNSVVSEFFEAAKNLKDGEYTKEPVKSSYGYHIILKKSSTPRKDYKDIKDTVKNDYAKNLLSTDGSLQTVKWAELREKYKLSIKDDVIKEKYEKTVDDAKNTKTEE